MGGGADERKVCREVAGARAACALRAFFIPAFFAHTIKRMELIRFVTEAIIAWVRDTIINLSGRIAEDFVSKRMKRRRRRIGRRKSTIER